MLNTDKQIFIDNLKLTQAYCDLQLKNDIIDNAKIFRTYNPRHSNKDLFSFKTEYFGFEIKPNLRHCTLTKWAIDPTDRESIVNNLFVEQINHKKQCIISIDSDKTYFGKILVSQIDCTVIDGASEVQSLGLIDIYDIPPIDTWFYIMVTKESRHLFAWIPNEYVHYANEAIEVNCVDCISWFDIFDTNDLDKYFGNEKESLVTYRTPNIDIANSGTYRKSISFWSRIKQLFWA